MEDRIVIASAARTAVGSFGGQFKNTSAVELGSIAAKEALKRANVKADMFFKQHKDKTLQDKLYLEQELILRLQQLHLTSFVDQDFVQ